jgi:hypothetical protein
VANPATAIPETPRPWWLRPGWLGPLRLRERTARNLLAGARALADRLGPWPVWLLAGVVLGTAPVLFDYALGACTYRQATGLLLIPLLVAAAAREWPGRGLTLLAATFAAHSLLVIALAAHDPARLSVVCAGGEDYWQRSRAWITTGVSEEYDLAWWVPAHCQLLAAMALLTYVSLGLVPVWQGLYEVDLMNFYVGRLLADSDAPGPGLVLGWHPWSVCRGIGYLLLTYEVVSLSLSRLTGERLCTAAARRRRWALGLLFLLADGLVKFFCLEPVRQVLHNHLP